MNVTGYLLHDSILERPHLSTAGMSRKMPQAPVWLNGGTKASRVLDEAEASLQIRESNSSVTKFFQQAMSTFKGVTMSVDKRRSPRKELRIKAILTIDAAKPVSLYTVDIARFGMGLTGLPEQLQHGQHGRLAFDLFLDGRVHNVDVEIRIAYCISAGAGFRAGLQFVDLDSDGATTIARYVGD